MVGSRSGVLTPHMNAILIKVDRTLQSLARRAGLVADSLNKIEGMVCNLVQGAMYAFPQVIMAFFGLKYVSICDCKRWI